jgi:hypothetical protein
MNKTQADTPTETLAHFACFSSLSRAPHRASQHRQSARKRRREPSQHHACPPVGGRADVERHHGVGNRLGFFLGRRKPEPVFFPHDGGGSGIYLLKTGGARQWRLSFYPIAGSGALPGFPANGESG